LNWNPELFPHKYVCHKHWPLELGPANDFYNLGWNPQYALEFITPNVTSRGLSTTTKSNMPVSTVWVLLTRHVRQVEREVNKSKEEEEKKHQFLTLHVYQNTKGRRIYYQQDVYYRGIYSNNPHTLVSLDVDTTTTTTTTCSSTTESSLSSSLSSSFVS
jgi:calpain-7